LIHDLLKFCRGIFKPNGKNFHWYK
jgi:hypothetical protein